MTFFVAVGAGASGPDGDSTNASEAGSHGFAGSSWQVTAYNNGKQAVVSVITGTRITARFGGDGRLTGSAGCNQYFAEYLVDNGPMAIGPPGATRRFCADPEGMLDQETGWLYGNTNCLISCSRALSTRICTCRPSFRQGAANQIGSMAI